MVASNTREPGRNGSLHSPSFIAILAALLGIGFAFAIPPFQFNDEHGHFLRAFQISHGQFVAPDDERFPAVLISLVQSYPEGNAKKFVWRSIAADFFAPPDNGAATTPPGDAIGQLYLVWAVRATRLYCPVVYGPASFGIRLGRIIRLSDLGLLYAARIANVLFFAGALYAALLLVPSFKLTLAAVAMMPMTLHQAAAVSADQVTISLALLGIAMVLRTREQRVGAGYLGTLLLVFSVLTLSKNSYWCFPLLLLIPVGQFRAARYKAAFVIAVVAAALSGVCLWNSTCQEAMGSFRHIALSRGIDPVANSLLPMRHPFQLIASLLSKKTIQECYRLIRTFEGTFGWDKILPPGWAQAAYLVFMVAVAMAEPVRKAFARWERLLMVSTAVAALLGTYYVLFIVDGRFANGVYSFASAGVQGRYLIPYSPLALLALKPARVIRVVPGFSQAVLLICTMSAVLSIHEIWRHYY